jgi:RHS repeat-associated protein
VAGATASKSQTAAHPLLWLALLFSCLAPSAYAQPSLSNDDNIIAITDWVNASDTTPAEADSYSLTPGTNRLASIATPAVTRNLAYDNRGNLASETRGAAVTATTAYDGHGRLISYARTGEDSFANSYNGLGDRVSTARTPTGGGSADIRTFVTAPDGRTMGEYGSSAIDVKAEFIWLSPQVGDAGSFGGDDGLGGYMPLAIALPTATSGVTQLNWVHGDHMGTPIVMTDASGTAVPQPSGYYTPAFPGQSKTLADLYYNRYRDYDPTTGRYIQADPIGLAGGANPYLYANGNPLRYMDPDGRLAWLIPVAGGMVIGAGSELLIQAGHNWWNNRNMWDRNCYEWGEVAFAGGLGAFGGNWFRGMVKLTKGSMKWNNVSRRIRRAEDMVGNPDIELHHWGIPRQWFEGKPWQKWGEQIANRPWNLNPVDPRFHDALHDMNPFLRTVMGAPRSVQAAGGFGAAGVAGELLDGGWE